jgi:hypothetical protein
LVFGVGDLHLIKREHTPSRFIEHHSNLPFNAGVMGIDRIGHIAISKRLCAMYFH